MEIRKLKKKDIAQVARLHRQELPGFLSELGEGFSKRFYRASLSIPELFTLVVGENEQILGFATGATSTERLYLKVILKNPIGFIFSFLSYFITHPKGITKLIKTITYPGFKSKSPELLTIAVGKQHQGRGIGRKLFEGAVGEFRKRRVRKFRVSAYDCLVANGFYRKMGGRFERQFMFLGEKMNYYTFNI